MNRLSSGVQDERKLKLMAVLAHPDDESLGFGGTLAKYSAEEVETYLITATRGERGRFFSPDRKTEPAEVGRVREAELRAAAAVLGVRDVFMLGYPDGAVDQVDAATAIAAIVQKIRRVRPHVVVTFGPDGAYGHPDHIAISQFTTAAIVCASDAAYQARDSSRVDRASAHRVFDHSLFKGHPGFYGYITSSAAPIGMLAEVVAAAVNANVGAWKLSPMATEIEAQTVRWLAQFIGYPADCGGLLLSGGNMANLTCFLAARAAKANWDVRKQGVAAGPRMLAYASTETHTVGLRFHGNAHMGTESRRPCRTRHGSDSLDRR